MTTSRLPSQMSHQFSRVPQAEIPRSSFDRSHSIKTTFDAGLLIPFFVDEALPGDTFNVDSTLFGRLSTPLKPIMDNLFLDTFWFFVPNRLIDDNWQKLNGEQENPGDSTDFLVPIITSPGGGYPNESIFDYMGIPTHIGGLSHSALWLRAYNLIWNQWFRDQNLQNSLVVHKDDGPDPSTDYVLQRRGKRHDYFTSCLPFPQKGPAVTLPLGSTAPVISNGSIPLFFSPPNSAVSSIEMQFDPGGATLHDQMIWSTAGGIIPGGPTGPAIFNGTNTGLETDLSSATAATINSLRQAFQVQKLFERDARGGTRYTEIIRSHFGVMSPDMRLQRPEVLGTDSVPIQINPVAQTSPVTGGSTPQGNLAGFGVVNAHGHGFTKSFTEHGVIIGLMSVRADLSYQQGLDRMWSRRTRFDFYWPALSHLGEQAVLNKEIFADGSGNDDLVFGYQERYAEYRYKPSKITGKFRSNDPQTLDIWHLAQNFGSLPTLSPTFIEDNPPVDRIVAVPSEPQFILDGYIRMRCARPMPVYSVPGLIDHF